jgi:hypothetical protein
MKHSARIAAAAAVAAVIGGTTAVAVPAFAASSSSGSTTTDVPASSVSSASLTTIKARAASAISVRQSALNTAITAVTGNAWLTSGDKATVLNTLNNDLSGLTALAPKIQADTTVAQARIDYQSIFLDYRVFALALPQARLAAAADDVTGAVIPRLTDAQTRLSGLLAGVDKSKDTPTVQAEMADLAAKISAITTATNAMSASLLALTPPQYNANHAILSGPRSALLAVRGDIQAARTDIWAVAGAIK